MLKDKNLLKVLLGAPDEPIDVNADYPEDGALYVKSPLADVSDDTLKDYLNWGFIYKKFDLMQYFFREYFRLGIICGFEKKTLEELEDVDSDVLRLEKFEKKLNIGNLYDLDKYQDELASNGREIHNFFSPHVLSLIANTISSAYVPFLAIGSDFVKYDEELVPMNLAKLSRLRDEDRDTLNMKTIYIVINKLKNVLTNIDICSRGTKFFNYKFKYDPKTKFKVTEIEKFKTLNGDFMAIMYNVNGVFVSFLKTMLEEQPANNSLLVNSKYLESMVTFLSNMTSNMSSYLLNIDKEILKNE